jgi:hypothetical protein
VKSWKGIDLGTGIVIVLTAALFCLSLVVHGFTHEVFLESGVFLISVKLILITTKLAASEQRLETHLKQIKELLANGKGASSMKETDPASSSASPLGERKKP